MIPKFHEMLKPMLEFLGDGKTRSMQEVKEYLVRYFKEKTSLTDEELLKRLPSGQSIFDNRAGWAKTYLLKAGLIRSPKRAHVEITDRGREVLKENPEEINVNYLLKFPEFQEFYESKQRNKDIVDQSPQDTISQAIHHINESLKNELLERILNSSPQFFEKLVVDLIVRMGYGGSFEEVAQVLGRSHDGGVDGVIKQDVLGLDNVYIQAKRWKDNTVGVKEIHSFVGALMGKGAKKGIFITTAKFSKEALEYASNTKEVKVILIDRDKLLDYMIKFNVGVQVRSVLEIKKIDEDYFEEL